jgi:hypothetical protein
MAAGEPIGYWLKRADALLTQRIDEVQRAVGGIAEADYATTIATLTRLVENLDGVD